MNIHRRLFLTTMAGAYLSGSTGKELEAGESSEKIRLGVITDLHQDIMHDGPKRMRQFLEAMQVFQPHALLQLGDFAYPKASNDVVLKPLQEFGCPVLHVLGNHDMDAGFTKEQCVQRWGIAGRFYSQLIKGYRVVVLDGNDRGSPNYRGGYPAYIAEDQLGWLSDTLGGSAEPIIVMSHQPLAGPAAIDNFAQVQKVLSAHASKILLAISGHTHIDYYTEIDEVKYLHVNSASYYWVGEKHRHDSFSAEVHKSHPTISRTCPYDSALFAEIIIDPKSNTIEVVGRETNWVGATPESLQFRPSAGVDLGENIAPKIRSRTLMM